jgi:hypothetical protein
MNKKVKNIGEIKPFLNGWEELPAKHQRVLRVKIADELGVDPFTVDAKRKGQRGIRKPEIPVIERCFQEYGVNPWTGEKCCKTYNSDVI